MECRSNAYYVNPRIDYEASIDAGHIAIVVCQNCAYDLWHCHFQFTKNKKIKQMQQLLTAAILNPPGGMTSFAS